MNSKKVFLKIVVKKKINTDPSPIYWILSSPKTFSDEDMSGKIITSIILKLEVNKNVSEQ